MAISVVRGSAILRLISRLVVIILGAPKRDHRGGLISAANSNNRRRKKERWERGKCKKKAVEGFFLGGRYGGERG
jgi:hypothetical protein